MSPGEEMKGRRGDKEKGRIGEESQWSEARGVPAAFVGPVFSPCLLVSLSPLLPLCSHPPPGRAANFLRKYVNAARRNGSLVGSSKGRASSESAARSARRPAARPNSAERSAVTGTSNPGSGRTPQSSFG